MVTLITTEIQVISAPGIQISKMSGKLSFSSRNFPSLLNCLNYPHDPLQLDGRSGLWPECQTCDVFPARRPSRDCGESWRAERQRVIAGGGLATQSLLAPHLTGTAKLWSQHFINFTELENIQYFSSNLTTLQASTFLAIPRSLTSLTLPVFTLIERLQTSSGAERNREDGSKLRVN